jgi:ABC-type branched-subunit amino acid transport system ATPase component
MLRPEERTSMGLAFVSGARPIFPDLTVLENLKVAAFRSHGGRMFEAAAEAIFELAPALEARRRSRAGVLSGGEQRLLAVAQTLFQRPIALLADELSLGLDLDARIAVLDLLRSLADDGVAVVAVDHDLPSLLPRADRAVLLSDGVAESFDDPVGLLDRRADLLPATFLAEVPR